MRRTVAYDQGCVRKSPALLSGIRSVRDTVDHAVVDLRLADKLVVRSMMPTRCADPASAVP